MATLAEIYDWFMTGKKPTQAQFWASWGSFYNKNESIPQSAVSNLTTVLNAKAEKTQFDAHKTDEAAHTALFEAKADAEALTNHLADETAHAALFEAKENTANKGVADGYAPLDELAKIPAEFLPEMESTPQDLQSVIDAASDVLIINGEAIGRVDFFTTPEAQRVDFYLELAHDIDETFSAFTLLSDGRARLESRNGDINHCYIEMNDGIIGIAQNSDLDKSTILSFEPPIAITNISLPAKPEGEYVLAVLEDIDDFFNNLNSLSIQELNITDPDDSENYAYFQKFLASIKKTLPLPDEALSSEPTYGFISCQPGNVSLGNSHLQPNGFLNKKAEIFCIGNSVQLVCEDYNHSNSTSYNHIFAVTSYQFEFSGNTPNGYKRIFLKLDNTVQDTTFNMPSSGFNLTTEEWVSQNFVKKAVVPASATATGVAGQIAFDADYIYLCVATDTWKRTPLTTW